MNLRILIVPPLTISSWHYIRHGAQADVTLVSWGSMLHETQAAAHGAQQGILAEVIDVATLKPLDMKTILDSTAKTGRYVIVHEAARLRLRVRFILAISAGADAVRLALRPCRKVAWFCYAPMAGFYSAVDSAVAVKS